jgi:hypothetical protein
MEHNEIPSLNDLKKAIQLLTINEDTPGYESSMANALGLYIEKLQIIYQPLPVFPLNLLPLPKHEIKKWGFKYAIEIIKKEGRLLQYQQDGVLSYTRFQRIYPSQFDAIMSVYSEEIIGYNMELRDTGSSIIELPEDLAEIINLYRKEYLEEAEELHKHLQKNSNRTLGCMKTIVVIICIILCSSFLFLISKH